MGSRQDVTGQITLESSLLSERIVFCSLLVLTLFLLLVGFITVTVIWYRRESARKRETRHKPEARWGPWSEEEKRFVKRSRSSSLIFEKDHASD
ncbi:hypothetical protein L198_01636 [Cryptococcus wingfieldii CBS 7118]|uniref:Uncharacterized protein n=1 Tax=Cryptococcus wingfieldii CBS 7118 TaxID=1295528 RepID=A0A1E3JZW2_9TREE|nr:hypothetical protein L198_01636 [Cryptococcus wingfieldii CBS 7118]ODO06404.1 hypothetical protein L198_01636 [Cryptococcus wingfieldii CBS 7118]